MDFLQRYDSATDNAP